MQKTLVKTVLLAPVSSETNKLALVTNQIILTSIYER